nr:T9SS type A sorting domain-containing protein [Candidatus Cloacimonadota bacterium]
YLTISNQIVSETQGDGDGIANPGEMVGVKIELFNPEAWYEANNINAVIRTQLNGVTIVDSVLNFPNIFSGFQEESTNSFTFTTPEGFNTYSIPFTLHLTAESAPGSTFNYSANIPFTVNLSLIQQGWPVNVGAASSSSPLLVDLKQDGQKVLVFGDTSGKVHALKADGTELTGFPVTISEGSNIMNGVAIANLSGDDKLEIVAATMNSTVKIIDHNGQVQATANLEGNIRNCPVIADVTGDSQPEILIGTQSKKLYVLNGTDLSINSGFPLTLEAAIIANLAAEDMNNDNKKELIVPTNQKLHVINGTTGEELTGWPVALSSPSLHGPTVANFDNDENTNEIVIAGSSATNCPITIYSKDGVVMSNILNPAAVKSEVTAFKMDSDNRYEIAYTDYSGSLYVRDASLSPVENFPVQVTPSVECSPVVYSLVENGQDNILFGDNDGYLHAFNMQGNEIAGFPVKCGQSLKVSPAIGNFDTDNDVDIMLPNQNEIVFVDYKSQGFDGKWASFRGNSNRSASVFDSSVAGEDVIVTPAFNALEQNYPNPFNPTTSIAFSLKQNSPVKLTVYNIKGQVVKSLINEKMNAGSHSITWNGKDNQNKSVSSGIYFYKLESHDFTSTRKMMLIK